MTYSQNAQISRSSMSSFQIKENNLLSKPRLRSSKVKQKQRSKRQRKSGLTSQLCSQNPPSRSLRSKVRPVPSHGLLSPLEAPKCLPRWPWHNSQRRRFGARATPKALTCVERGLETGQSRDPPQIASAGSAPDGAILFLSWRSWVGGPTMAVCRNIL